MPVAACVTYRARDGHSAEVERILRALRTKTLSEPGCLAYEPHCDPQDPGRFFLYELYVDGASYRDHQASSHFKRYALDELAAHLTDRRVECYETLAPSPSQP